MSSLIWLIKHESYSMEIIKKYFQLTPNQEQQFAALGVLYNQWNEKINVISRKDIQNLYCHHILHSLAIAKFIRFTPNTTIIDIGTGGGFPGIPLAILFPQCKFVLIDGIGKKIKVANEISKAIGLNNTTCIQARAEEVNDKFDFIISRATMTLAQLTKLTKKNIYNQQHNAQPNGIISLKGGELQQEIQPYKNIAEIISISDYFNEEYFKTKKIIYLPL